VNRGWPPLALSLLLALVACSTAPNPARPTAGGDATPVAWHAPLDRDHPLTGRIWDVRAAQLLDERALVARLTATRFVLLGEKHDNVDHHLLQARVVRALTAAGRHPAVAFEMFTADQAPTIAAYLAKAPRDAAGLGDAVGWRDSGWPDWAMYQPIAQAALDAGAPILAANLATATVRTIATGAGSALPPALVSRYGLDHDLPPDVQAAMAEDIRESHCGHANDALVQGMIAAQRARDATMAETLVDGERDGAVLISGSGHARVDRGVPSYLRIARPDATIASIGFVEVLPDHPTPADYDDHFGGTRIPFDYVWFTPRVDDEDPCEAFKKSLERLRERR
jgi:uncharacterized iron-regulated protein